MMLGIGPQMAAAAQRDQVIVGAIGWVVVNMVHGQRIALTARLSRPPTLLAALLAYPIGRFLNT
jgi:hypothetical protein